MVAPGPPVSFAWFLIVVVDGVVEGSAVERAWCARGWTSTTKKSPKRTAIGTCVILKRGGGAGMRRVRVRARAWGVRHVGELAMLLDTLGG